jgi:N-dimethylarginine dimethylaminohydrolase
MTSYITPLVHSETGRLRKVVLGRADDMGPTPKAEECFDAKSLESVLNGVYPVESDLIPEMEAFARILRRYDVEVFRPDNISGLNQIFARDISFAIEDKLIMPNIIEDREEELKGIKHIHHSIHPDHYLEFRDGVYAEGGDLMPWRNYIFIGYSPGDDFDKYQTARTNRKAVDRLQEIFPEKTVRGFQLHKNDTDPREGVLHLDCCFQPIGTEEAIIYKGGFKSKEDVRFLEETFGEEKLISVEKEEFYRMFPNIFSISPEVIVSNASFVRLNQELRRRGYTVEEVPYDEVSKMGGLLRCSTMPLQRDRLPS